MDRRGFLSLGGRLGAAALLWPGMWLGEARAAPGGRVLVTVFLRGGWDGLNVAVPYGEDAYYKLRPTIAVPPPHSGKPEAALDLDGFFGLHPALEPLLPLYHAGRMAVLPAVQYSGATRSHFLGQDIIEHADTKTSASGWLGRYLLATPGDAVQKAMSLADGVPRSLAGAGPVPAYADLASLSLAADRKDRDMLAAMIGSRYGQAPPAGHPYGERLHGAGRRLLEDLDALREIGQRPADNGAVYPNTLFGRQMRQAAGLVKYRPGLDAIALNLGGWDTHSAQGGGQPEGRMSRQLRQFAEAVAAFFTDLGYDGSRVLLLAVTEFGRTAAENASGGTDHGHASTWLAIGAGVQGGVHTGMGWPGLESHQLLEGRYLAHAIDFRSVYAEVLTRFLGVSNTTAILPGYTPKPVGMLV
ncbi:MAG: DUF1501 domain-containing protein [Thiobacillaceae bacterium]